MKKINILKRLSLLLTASAALFLCGCTIEEMEKLLGLDVPKEA